MPTHHVVTSLSRRAALAGLGAGSLGLALAATTRHAAAQDTVPGSYAGHPGVRRGRRERGRTACPVGIVTPAEEEVRHGPGRISRTASVTLVDS
jgi:hypothetical protein